MCPTARRSGFTLVEMMVAMTLTVFVMVILSQCFVAGLETFGTLKAIGDMQEELRTATNLLRADLSVDHFEGKRRLSDPVINLTSGKIQEGFFVIGQGYPPTGITKKVAEGSEDGVPSYRATDQFLHFSAKMRGNAREKFFSAPAASLSGLPGLGSLNNSYVPQIADAVFQESDNVIHSAWAEIVWLVLPTGTTINPGIPSGPGNPLYALYRCQYVVLPETTEANAAKREVRGLTNADPFINVAGIPITNSGGGPKVIMHFLSPNDLASGYATRTFNPYAYFAAGQPINNQHPPRGAALVLSNVLSFQVQVMKNPSTTGDFEDLALGASDPKTGKGAPIPFDTANYVNAPALPPVYRNVSMTPSVPPYSITGLQIIIRIWDPKSQLTRQVTLLQDM
jgi:prepilin-type N-terminal cleavage/methylation domain-containing protein